MENLYPGKMGEKYRAMREERILTTLDRQGRNKISKDIDASTNVLGVIWPHGPLSEDITKDLVELATRTSLRTIVGEYLFFKEGFELSQKAEQFFAKIDSDIFPDTQSALKGFKTAGRNILSICEYIDHPLDFEKRMQLRMEAKGKTLDFSNFDSVISRGIVSITIDPTGIDLLKINLHGLAFLRNRKILIDHTPSYGGDHPEVLGYRHFVERYIEVYAQLAQTGAKVDASDLNPLGRKFKKVQRGVRETAQLHAEVWKDIAKDIGTTAQTLWKRSK